MNDFIKQPEPLTGYDQYGLACILHCYEHKITHARIYLTSWGEEVERLNNSEFQVRGTNRIVSINDGHQKA